MFSEIKLSSPNILKKNLCFQKWNVLAQILKNSLYFLKRKLLLYFPKRRVFLDFQKQNPALFSPSPKNKELHLRKIYYASGNKNLKKMLCLVFLIRIFFHLNFFHNFLIRTFFIIIILFHLNFFKQSYFTVEFVLNFILAFLFYYILVYYHILFRNFS